MDEQLRALERAYSLEPSGDNLLALLQTFARSGQDRIPEGDILSLALINQQNEWYRSFDQSIIQNLLSLGYPIGVYFHLTIKMDHAHANDPTIVHFPDLSDAVLAIRSGLVRQASNLATRIRSIAINEEVGRIDFIGISRHTDDYCLSPANSTAREEMDDGRLRYEQDAEEVAQQLLSIPSDLTGTMLRYSSIIKARTTKRGKTTAIYRIFIPAEELERAYWPLFVESKGFRRATVRQYGRSMIDWNTKRQFKRVQAALFSDVNEWVQRRWDVARLDSDEFVTSCAKLGSNLLLALSGYFGFRERSWLR